MPLYEFECPACGLRHEEFRKLEHYDAPSRCVECGRRMARVLSAAVVHGFEEYADPNLVDSRDSPDAVKRGFVVKSRKHKQQRLKDLGLYEFGPNDPRHIQEIPESHKHLSKE